MSVRTEDTQVQREVSALPKMLDITALKEYKAY